MKEGKIIAARDLSAETRGKQVLHVPKRHPNGRVPVRVDTVKNSGNVIVFDAEGRLISLAPQSRVEIKSEAEQKFVS